MKRDEADRMRSVFLRQTGGILLAVALLLVTLLAGTGLLGLSGHFLIATALAGASAAAFNLFAPSAGIRALTFARILSRYGERVFGHQVTLALARDLRVWFFRRALPRAPLGLGRLRVGDLLARLVADVEAVDGMIVRAIGPLLALLLLWLIGIAATFAVHGPAAWLMAGAGALIAAVTAISASAVRSIERERAAVRAELRYALMEGVEGATDLIAFDGIGIWRADILAIQQRVSRCELQRKRWLNLGVLLQGVVAAVLLAALAAIAFAAFGSGALSAPAAGGLFFMAMGLLEAAAGIGAAWQAWMAARASASRLQAVVSAPVALPMAGAAALPDHGSLALEQVTLRWPGQPRDVLQCIGLTLPPGGRIAIQGDSGAGKSSLFALLLRLRDPDGGCVRFGGADLRESGVEAWQRKLAWLPQDAPVFAGSVRENLRMGDPDADDARMWAVLERVRLDGLVRSWASGLDGWVGENGATLSAGQARRLALARALLRDAPILLLDEPTEGLDQDTAEALMIDLVRAAEGRSVLIITHAELPSGTVHERYRLIEGRLLRQRD